VAGLDEALGLCLSDADVTHVLLDPRGVLFQRLEFVGDSLLDATAVRALLLRERWDQPRLGDLAQERQTMVSDRALVRASRHVRLPVVRTFRASAQRLGDRIEACVGAAWVDGGIPAGVWVAHHLVVDPALGDEPELPVRLPARGANGAQRPLAEAVEAGIDHSFTQRGWLTWALDGRAERRRLAQLGDAALEAAAACGLYESHPYATEGELTALRQQVQTNHRVAQFGHSLGLRGVNASGRAGSAKRTREADRDAADSMQAVIGAVAMDSGIPAAVRAGRRVLRLAPEDPGRRRWHP
jgi:dsRNA-specific ribonuclease